MNRNNEEPSANAGARFIAQCKKLGFQAPVMIYTSNKEEAKKKMNDQGIKDFSNLAITTSYKDAIGFMNFKNYKKDIID